MDSPRILVIDDDFDLRFLLERSFGAEGYSILIAENGEKGLTLAKEESPDLVILDIMLPEISGLEVCKRIREIDSEIYIIMLTQLDDDFDKVRGLEMGADDYVTKPFNMLELSARVKAVLRRKNQSGKDEEIRFGEVSVNFVTREVYRKGAPVEFTQKEFELLTYLIRRPGEAVSREKIFEDIWGQSSGIGTRNIDNFILRIRKKLEADPAHPSHFMTIYGFGYKFLPGDS